MAGPRNAIMVDDDDNVGSPPGSLRSRLASLVSTASSTTLRAESEEPRELPRIERLNVQPPAQPQSSRDRGLQGANRKRGSSSVSDGENERTGEKNSRSIRRQNKRRATQVDREVQGFFELDEEDVEFGHFEANGREIINVEDAEAEAEEEIRQEENYLRNRMPQNIPARNPPISLPFAIIESCKWNDSFLKVDKAVELWDGNFLKIKTVVKNLRTKEVFLRGWLLKRNNRMLGIFPMKLNEVCFVLEKDLDDPRSVWDQSILEVKLKDVAKLRKLICTNRPFPECRFDSTHLPHTTDAENRHHVAENEVLVCRWIITTDFDSSQVRLRHAVKPQNFLSGQIELVPDNKCSAGYANPLSTAMRRFRFRGVTDLDGSYQQPWGASAYSYGDAFCGCGGAMRGASRAGLKPRFGVDNDPIPLATLKKNFPDVDIYEMSVNEFVSLPDPDGNCKCDVLHISPVCCFFSGINTGINKRRLQGQGQKDEANEVTLFSVEHLLRKSKPRIVTVEQTFGLMLPKYRWHFNQLLRQFVDNEFSVRWERVMFAGLGLPSERKRLIMIGACPGETTPKFPARTHSEHGGNGLRLFTTPREALQQIPRTAKNHNIASARGRSNYMPWDDLKTVNCITTNGGVITSHPSGLRGSTPREIAALNGFDNRFEFLGTTTEIRKQIGNAVPPSIAKIFFTCVRKHLEEADAAEKRRGANR